MKSYSELAFECLSSSEVITAAELVQVSWECSTCSPWSLSVTKLGLGRAIARFSSIADRLEQSKSGQANSEFVSHEENARAHTSDSRSGFAEH
jgi:hypothetical protein